MSNHATDIHSSKSALPLKIGLYFGTFNPIHNGHMAIANYIVEYSDIDQLWFVVSPQNPHKRKQNLLKDHHRLAMVRCAVEYDNRFRVSNIEFGLPKPSYTIDTLTYLKEQYPEYYFKIIMGSDNLKKFHQWKNYEQIISNYGVIVYPRPGFEPEKYQLPPSTEIVEAPQMEISSTFIRNAIKEGKDVRYFLPLKTWEYLDEMNFYK